MSVTTPPTYVSTWMPLRNGASNIAYSAAVPSNEAASHITA